MTIITLSNGNIVSLRVFQRPEGDWLATHAVLTTAALGATADAAVSRWLELAQQEYADFREYAEAGRLSRTGLDTLAVLERLFGEGAGE